jgi:hypothetical protein
MSNDNKLSILPSLGPRQPLRIFLNGNELFDVVEFSITTDGHQIYFAAKMLISGEFSVEI